MANQTDPNARQVHGANPQFLIEKILRLRIYENRYWKEQCFGLTAETLIDKAVKLESIGGSSSHNVKPTPFICLLLKLLQIQPDMDIVIEFIHQEDYKYLRALGAFYIRLVARPAEVYRLLEPLLEDYRKLAKRSPGGWELVHMDEFVDELLIGELCCDITLPMLQRRAVLEASSQLGPRESLLDDELDDAEEQQVEVSKQKDDDSMIAPMQTHPSAPSSSIHGDVATPASAVHNILLNAVTSSVGTSIVSIRDAGVKVEVEQQILENGVRMQSGKRSRWETLETGVVTGTSQPSGRMFVRDDADRDEDRSAKRARDERDGGDEDEDRGNGRAAHSSSGKEGQWDNRHASSGDGRDRDNRPLDTEREGRIRGRGSEWSREYGRDWERDRPAYHSDRDRDSNRTDDRDRPQLGRTPTLVSSRPTATTSSSSRGGLSITSGKGRRNEFGEFIGRDGQRIDKGSASTSAGAGRAASAVGANGADSRSESEGVEYWNSVRAKLGLKPLK